MYINTITITLTIAPEFSSVKTCIWCYSQSYSDRVDIQVLTELNSGAIVSVKVIVLIYTF
jgi:hypothetical protein